MIYRLYVIYDKVAETYGAPYVSLNDATAVRHFQHQIAGNLMAEPSDFELFACGVFSITSGIIEPLPKLEFIQKGKVMKNEQA